MRVTNHLVALGHKNICPRCVLSKVAALREQDKHLSKGNLVQAMDGSKNLLYQKSTLDTSNLDFETIAFVNTLVQPRTQGLIR